MGKVIVTRTKETYKWTRCTGCWFSILSIVAEILLCGAVALVLFWVLKYRDGFGWKEKPELEFNLHPVLMITGFIFLVGQALLVYRVCRCCKRIYSKLIHTVLHLMAMPVIGVGVVAVFDYHNLNRVSGPIPNLYSMHSWMGLITLGLFGIQFMVGFFSFLVLLCCDSKTANYRASLQPIHAHFGLATFVMAIGTCLTGLTEKALFAMDGRIATGNKAYKDLPPEAIVVNTLAMVLVATGLVMTFLIRYPRFQRHLETFNERL